MEDKTDKKQPRRRSIRGGLRFRKWGYLYWIRREAVPRSKRRRRRAAGLSIAMGVAVAASIMVFCGGVWPPSEMTYDVPVFLSLGFSSFMAVSLGIATAQILYDTMSQHIVDDADSADGN